MLDIIVIADQLTAAATLFIYSLSLFCYNSCIAAAQTYDPQGRGGSALSHFIYESISCFYYIWQTTYC